MNAWLSYWPKTYITVGITAFVLSAVAMPGAIWLLRRIGMMDRADTHKIHTAPVPRGGGIVIFLAFAAAVLWPGYRSHEMNGVLIGAFICLCVGALDDFTGGIKGSWKFLTLLGVTIILWRFGVRVNIFKYAPLDILFTLIWIVGVTSAFNGIDNMDGLASGTAIIVSTAYLIIAVQAYLLVHTETSLSWFGMLATGLIGANIGFLLYNWRPAKIFMGDAGSFFLGFTLAALGVMGEWTENRLISCTIPMLILGVPIMDFAYILITRIMRGETRTLREVIDHCGTDHISHRLVWIGFNQRNAVLFIYLISFSLAISGILLRNSSSLFDSALALFQSLAVFAIVAILMGFAIKKHVDIIRDEVERIENLPPANQKPVHRMRNGKRKP